LRRPSKPLSGDSAQAPAPRRPGMRLGLMAASSPTAASSASLQTAPCCARLMSRNVLFLVKSAQGEQRSCGRGWTGHVGNKTAAPNLRADLNRGCSPVDARNWPPGRKFVPAARHYAAARREADVGLRVNEICMLDLDDVC